MKTKPKENRDKRKGWLECMDEINRHRGNAGVLAGLLENCKPGIIDGELVMEAGLMIREELQQVREWTLRLHKELRELQ